MESLLLKVPVFTRALTENAFDTWEKALRDYFVAVNVTQWQQKLATMRLVGGVELRELLESLPEANDDDLPVSMLLSDDPYLREVAKLRRFFEQNKNPALERYEFHKMEQYPDESMKDFVTRLRTKARNCKFDKVERAIMDQIIAGTNDKKTRERLLSKKTRSVQEVLDVASMNETLKSFEPSRSMAVMATSEKIMPRKQQFGVNRAKIECRQCGKQGHIRRNCPERVCNFCGGIGHWKNECRKLMKRKASQQAIKPEPQKKPKMEQVSEVSELLNFLCGTKSVTGCIGGVNIELLIDSGCVSNLIDRTNFELMQRQGAAISNFTQKIDKKFIPFGTDVPLKMMGSFEAIFTLNNITHNEKFFVVDAVAKCLLGVNAAQKFGVLKICNDVSEI